MHYDFGEYVNSIKYLDKEDILQTSYKKHKALDKLTVLDKKEGGRSLQDNIQFLLLFLEKGERSPQMADSDFAKLRPICESLVKKNQLAPEVFHFFEGRPPSL